MINTTNNQAEIVCIQKLTSIDLMHECCEFTMHGNKKSELSLDKIYRCEHSPMRSQIFTIKLYNVPTFVSVHFVRHNIGINHFVLSNRNDRGGAGDDVVNRLTPVNHMMILNAESIINMSHARLCNKASELTRIWMQKIRNQMLHVDAALYNYMVPKCVYRNGKCGELRPCGEVNKMMETYL